ncbi:hypothetical protein CKAH01_10256 [Colletotrichum kahawae]|uniref:Uncharacterized protein n=1 Tax=Colletotrichum kahawae TaxID=34407 RepID=A0AAD9XYR3_COLKA|nr:hypothetical protein CKAH01_10256 [Colletotrichum kahawae]
MIFMGSTTVPVCTLSYNMLTLPTAMASTTRTTSPLNHNHTDDVIYLGSRTVTQTLHRPRQPDHPRRFPNDKKQPPRQSSTKKKRKPKPLRKESDRKTSPAERALVGWIRSPENKRHAVYGSLQNHRQLRYWSVSDNGDNEMIKHEDIDFRSMFQNLSPDEIRKKLQGKIRRASGRLVQDEK